MLRYTFRTVCMLCLMVCTFAQANALTTDAPRFLWADDEDMLQSQRQAGDYVNGALAYLQRSYDEGGVESLRFMSVHDTGRGPVVVRFQSYYDDIPVFGRSISVILDRAGQLVAISGQLVDGASSRNGNPPNSWRLMPEQAMEEALNLMGKGETRTHWQYQRWQGDYHVFSKSDQSQRIRVKPFYVPMYSRLTPAYYVETGLSLTDDGKPRAMAYILSAQDASLISDDNRIDDYEAFSYRVFTDANGTPLDDPYGNNQPHPTGMADGFLPTVPAPQPLITTAEFSAQVDDPWLPDGATETRGNNVDAFYNSIITADGVFDLSFSDPASSAVFRAEDGDFRAAATSAGTFDYFYDELAAPSDYVQLPPTDPGLPVPQNDPQLNAKIVNGFYVINYLHDLFYDAGFDEAAGNAQQDNFGRGGLDGDPIVFMAGFPLGIFIVSLGDGESPQVFQGINFFSQSQRDATLDFAVIGHEWGHYIVRRLVGGSTGFLTNKQGGALNEGWADFIGLFMQVNEEDGMLTSAPAWNRTFASGAYLNRDYRFFTPVVTGTANFDTYFHGVRRYPYSVDMQRNPLTFSHISKNTPLPANVPVFDWRGRSRYNTEVHAAGEVWANSLWECYNGLLNKRVILSFQEKRARMAEYLVASLKATPFNPTYTEARNALLAVMKAADQRDFRICQKAMAKRGLGAGAVSPPRDSQDLVEVRESFSTESRAVSFISASVDDSLISNDNDGILDAGEEGLLSVTLRNTGFRQLPFVIGRFQQHPAYRFKHGGIIFFYSGAPGEDLTAQIPVRLLDDTEYADTPFNLRIFGFGPATPDPSFSLRTHFDLANNGTVDNVEKLPSFADWTVSQSAFTAFHPADPKWRRAQLNGNFVYQAKEGFAGYQSYLTTPELQVSASEALVLQFDHAYKLEKEPDPIFGTFKGIGSIEFTTDGGANWTNINALIPDHQDFSNTSFGYPELIPESFDFGAALAGETVQFRFFANFAETFSEFYLDGWFVDNISFEGIDNTPFTQVLPNELALEKGNFSRPGRN